MFLPFSIENYIDTGIRFVKLITIILILDRHLYIQVSPLHVLPGDQADTTTLFPSSHIPSGTQKAADRPHLATPLTSDTSSLNLTYPAGLTSPLSL